MTLINGLIDEVLLDDLTWHRNHDIHVDSFPSMNLESLFEKLFSPFEFERSFCLYKTLSRDFTALSRDYLALSKDYSALSR